MEAGYGRQMPSPIRSPVKPGIAVCSREPQVVKKQPSPARLPSRIRGQGGFWDGSQAPRKNRAAIRELP